MMYAWKQILTDMARRLGGRSATHRPRKPAATRSPQLGAGLTRLEDRVVPALLINEISVNPPSGTDQPFEYIELRSTDGATVANGTYLVALDGNGSNVGLPLAIYNLSGITPDAATKLIMIKASVGGWSTSLDAGAIISDATLNAGGDGLLNDTISWLLIDTTPAGSATPDIDGDYDANDNGTLDSGAENWTILDAVGWKDSAGDKIYGGVQLTQASGTPDAATRFGSGMNMNTANSASAWYNGDLKDTSGNNSVAYDLTKASSNLPAGAVLTPGAVNAANVAGTPQLAITTASTFEPSSSSHQVTLTFFRVGGASGTLNATVWIGGGSATAGTDFTMSTSGFTLNGGYYKKTNALSWADGDLDPKTIVINIQSGGGVESPETFDISVDGGSTFPGTYTIYDNADIPSTTVKLNEAVIDNPGDDTNEFVEIKGAANDTLAGLYLVAINGDQGGNPGQINRVFDLSPYTLDGDGLLTITDILDTYSFDYSSANYVENGFINDWLGNGSLTLALISSRTPLYVGQDLDADNSGGSLDLPSGATVSDSVGWRDGNDNDDRVFGTSTQDNGAGAGATFSWANEIKLAGEDRRPGAISRKLSDSDANDGSAWEAGFLQDDNDGLVSASTLQYNRNTPLTGGSTVGVIDTSIGGIATPGAVNQSSGAAGVVFVDGESQYSEYADGVATSRTVKYRVYRSGGTTGEVSADFTLAPSGIIQLTLGGGDLSASIPGMVTGDAINFASGQYTGTLVFGNGVSFREIELTIVDDSTDEQITTYGPMGSEVQEQATLTLSTGSYHTPAALGGRTEGTITVFDDDNDDTAGMGDQGEGGDRPALISSSVVGTVLINEVSVNPPGNQDAPREFIELKTDPNKSLEDYYLVIIEGDRDQFDKGRFDRVLNLGSLGSITNNPADLHKPVVSGANGLILIVGSSATALIAGADSDTTVVTYPGFDLPPAGAGTASRIGNGAVTFMVLYSPTGIPGSKDDGRDYDANDDGTLDNLPDGAIQVDAIGWQLGVAGTNTPSGYVYGGAVNLSTTLLASGTTGFKDWTPDAAVRVPTNTTPNDDADGGSTANRGWLAFDLTNDTDPDLDEINYDPLVFAPELTPGNDNIV